MGCLQAKQSELVISRAHELLQASNVISMLMVLGSKSVAEFLGESWLKSHKGVTSSICELESAIEIERKTE